MILKRVFTSIGLVFGLLTNVPLCVGATYTVTYNGNGATSGSMSKETFEVGTTETTTLSSNTYKRAYTVSFDANGGNTISPMECNYSFNGWLHDTLLTEVTNNMEANWYNISTTQGSSYDLELITLSTADGVNTISMKPKSGTRERLYSKPIYMPAGNYGLSFKFCSPTGYQNLGSSWSILFKLSACTMAQDVYCNDQGLIYTSTDTSAVLLNGEAGSTTLSDRSFTIYASGTTPVYLAINGGNLYDGLSYQFKFADYVLSLNGKTYMTYADQEATQNMVREEGGNVSLKAMWAPNSIILPTPEREGYTFVGWNTKSDGTGDSYKAGDEYTPTADQTLYAMWELKISDGEYKVVYDGNGATSGSMKNHIYKIGVDETTLLDTNAYQLGYTVSYDVDGGTAISPVKVNYKFNGWLHDTLLTEVTNNMENWNNVTTNNSTGSVSDTSIIVKYENGVNLITANTLFGTRERFYSRAFYVPAGDYDLTFKFCSPTGYTSLQSDWESLFKMSACNIPQATSGSDEGRFTSGTNKSAVVLEGNTASDVLEDRSLTIYANNETPVYLATNYGNVKDRTHYQFKYTDLVLSINGKSYLIYEDEAPTINLVREDGGTVKLKAQWEPTSIILPTPEKEGYTFVGWNTKSDGTGDSYKAGDEYTPTADQTLYAMWKQKEISEGEYTVVYDGNGATSGSMENHIYKIGVDETTKLDSNTYQRSYTVSYDVDGGTAISPVKVNYNFNGWLHDTLLTEVTNNFKANWTAMSYDKYNNEVPGMFTLSNYNNGVNNYTVKTSSSCWEHLYSEPIYMPAGTFTLSFKESSSTGIAHLSIENSWLFKVSACDRAQIECGGDQGLLTSGDSSSAVIIDTEASTEMKDYSFDVFSVGGPVYISINGGNLYDGRTYKLSFSDFVLSYNGSTSLTYADQEPTVNMVREDGGTVKLKAQWEPTSIILPTPEKEGYTFVGWNTKSDGTGDSYKAGDEYTPTADQTLYAMWGTAPTYTQTETESICEGTTYIWEGDSYSAAGTYTKSFTAKEGGDSTRILNLTVLPIQRATISDSITDVDYYTFGGKKINVPGTYRDTLTSVYGCDSIVTLNLYHKEIPTFIYYLDFCFEDREDYDPSRPIMEYIEAKKDTLRDEEGKSYISISYMKILRTQFVDLEESICEGESYTFGGKKLTKSGIYGDTLRNSCDCCDSIITTLNLTVVKGATSEISDEICEGRDYTFNGNTASYESGVVKLTAVEPGSYGCDSTTLLTLNVLPSIRTQMWDTIMVGESYNNYGFNVAEQYQRGTYTYSQTITGDEHCDSIITLNLVVNPMVDNKDIPTAFSPSNQDGVNDIFMNGYDVYIYDRYGNMICHSATGWDGKYRDEYADPGVYVYVITMKDGQKKKGTIEVLKD